MQRWSPRLAAALAVALALRLGGITFGLPFLYHPDEPAHVLQALAVARGLPNGLTFANPPLYKYLLLAEYTVTYGLGRLAGAYTSPQQFIDQFRADPSLLYLLARCTSAVLGTLTVGAVYWLGRLLRGEGVGAVAAGLAGVTYLLVRESHFGVNDALVTLGVSVGLGFCVRIVCGGTRRDYLAAGAALGLAFAAKYQGAISLVPLLLAHTLRPRPRCHRHLLLALATACLSGLLAFPSLVLEPVRVVQDVYSHLYVPARTGYDGLDPAGGYVYYLKTLAIGLGWPMLAAASIGFARAWLRRERALLVVASLPGSLVLVMGASAMYFARFILPAVPALVVLAAVGLDWPGGRARRLLAWSLVIVVGLATLVDSLRFDLLLGREDTRTQARAWIMSQLPSDARLAVDAPPLGPVLDGAPQDVQVANAWELADSSLAEYRQRGITYIVTSSFVRDARALDADRESRRQDFYTSLDATTTLIMEFRPSTGTVPAFVYDRIYAPFDALWSFDRPGPTIRVYALQRER